MAGPAAEANTMLAYNLEARLSEAPVHKRLMFLSPRPTRLGRFRPRLSEALVPFADERLHRRPAGYNLLLIGPAF